jgi:hypothetical protein
MVEKGLQETGSDQEPLEVSANLYHFERLTILDKNGTFH